VVARAVHSEAGLLDTEALTRPGQAPLAIAFINDFLLLAGASPGFVMRSYSDLQFTHTLASLE
jgi:hypothetical protein